MKYKVDKGELFGWLFGIFFWTLGFVVNIGWLIKQPSLGASCLVLLLGGGVVGCTYGLIGDLKDGSIVTPSDTFDFEREAINQKAQQLLDEAKELGRR